MADMVELKNMVMSFRVSELQVLLGFAGRNKSGRKQELLQRALSLLHRGCSTPIQIKIRELYRRRYPVKSSAPPHPVHPPSASSGIGGGGGEYNIYSHNGLSSPPHQVPVHPDVRLKQLPFYDVLAELLKPSSLVPRGPSRFQETFFVFHLTPQQAHEIALSRDMRPGAKYEFSVQIQLRFSLLETSCDQEDNFPPSICVRMNGKMAPLPNPIPTNKPGVEPKRPSRPVNITSICRISPTVANHINISWASELGRSYCVAVYLVRRLTSDILLSRLKQSGVKHADHTRALIKEKLAHDPDSEIATTSLRVSLMCPLGKMRMTLPCRASTCNHLQCFDAPTYLQMNEKKPTWTCPVCDKAAEFDNLVIDGLFSELLKQCPDASEIKFLEDGSWHPIKSKDAAADDPDDAECHTIGDSESPKKGTGGSGDTDVIDLTETDDEDEGGTTVADTSSSSVGSVELASAPISIGSDSSSSSSSSSGSSSSSSGSSVATVKSHSRSSHSPPPTKRVNLLGSSLPMSPIRAHSNGSGLMTPQGQHPCHDTSAFSMPAQYSPRRPDSREAYPKYSSSTRTSRSSSHNEHSSLSSPSPSYMSGGSPTYNYSSSYPYPTGASSSYASSYPYSSTFSNTSYYHPSAAAFYSSSPPAQPLRSPSRDSHHRERSSSRSSRDPPLPVPPPDLFRDPPDLSNLDLYSLLHTDNDTEREFEFLRGMSASISSRMLGSYGLDTRQRSSAMNTPTLSVSSNSSTSPDVISLD